jgi:hypothetical protein
MEERAIAVLEDAVRHLETAAIPSELIDEALHKIVGNRTHHKVDEDRGR